MSFKEFRRKFRFGSRKDGQNQESETNTCPSTSRRASLDAPEHPDGLPGFHLPPVETPLQASPFGGPGSGRSQTPAESDTPIRELWNLAYENLRKEDEALVVDYEAKLLGDLSAGLASMVGSKVRDRMHTILQRKMDEVNRDVWKLKFGSSEFQVRELIQSILGIVDRANKFVATALSANPHASLAWAGVGLLLPLFLNPSKQVLSLVKGLDDISSLLVQSWLWEDLYVRRYESEPSPHKRPTQSHAAYKITLEKLYRQILKFQAASYCYYSKGTASRLGLDVVKWNEWDNMLNEVKAKEKAFAAVREDWRDTRYDEECLATAGRHQEAIKRWQDIGTGVSGLKEAVREAQEEKRRDGFLDWLCEVDPSNLYNSARDKHESGTCDWLVRDSEEFKTWNGSSGALLWLHGKAGCGKSILSSSVVKYLHEQYEFDPGSAFAYFFFSFSEADKQNISIMLASLLKQLYASRPDTPQLVKSLSAYKQKGMRPDSRVLEDALIATTYGFSSVSLVIDALDECPAANGERRRLLDTLHRITTKMPDNLHVFLTSRAEPDIVASINTIISRLSPSGAAIDLTTDQGGIDRDIGLYIDSRLASESHDSWPDEVKAKAKDLLIKRADGMFQYVVCQFEDFRGLHSLADINEALERLPPGLDATYDRALHSINSKFRSQAVSLLKWLVGSIRPLLLEELAETCTLYPEHDSPFDTGRRRFSPKDCIEHISSLVVLSVNTEWSWKGGNRSRPGTYVRLAHFSVKEYLTSDRMAESSLASFSFTEVDAHLHIACSSLAYHSYYSLTNSEQTHDPELRKYTTRNWPVHFEMVPREKWPDNQARLAMRALAPGSQSLRVMVTNSAQPEYPHELCLSPFSYDRNVRYMLQRPLCYTARLGFLKLTEMLLDTPETNRYLGQRDLDAALRDATYGGRLAIVRLLLSRGACGNAKSPILGTPLQFSAWSGDTAITNLLLDNGADVNAQHGKHKSALQIAVRQENLHLVKLLVSRGADVNLPPKNGDSVLASATRNNSTEILQFLLSSGADINSQSRNDGTALHDALAWGRNKPHSRLLLKSGADVNAQGGRYGNALQAICANSKTEIELVELVELLLGRGADVDRQGGLYGTALQAICVNITTEIELVKFVQLLLDRGADINKQGGLWGTALQAACRTSGRQDLVEFLLEKGADVNIQGGEYGNALQAACHRGYLGVVLLLFEWGADVNARGGKFDNALQAACCGGHLEVAQLLIDRGADINASGGEHGSALHAAAAHHEREGTQISLLQLLLGKGAEVNKQAGRYGTPLQCASLGHSVDSVRVLLDHGADVNAQGGEWGSALQAACTPRDRMNIGIARLLIERGADIHVQGGVFGSPWHAAASIGRFVSMRIMGTKPLLQLLLDHGANVNDTQGRQHATALQAALEDYFLLGPETEHILIGRVRFLLEHGADVNQTGGTFGSPLQSACANKRGAKRAKYLLQTCPNLEVKATGGMFGSALQAAAYSGQSDSVRLLLEKGADPNAGGGKYRSALNAAVFTGSWDIVELLLEHGAKSDRQQLGMIDEEWLAQIQEEGFDDKDENEDEDMQDYMNRKIEYSDIKYGKIEDGKEAVERYRIFWERQPVDERDI